MLLAVACSKTINVYPSINRWH